MKQLRKSWPVRWLGLVVFGAALAAGAAACSDSATSPSGVTLITVSGTAPVVGASAQLTATATLASGSTQDVTSIATWQSSNVSVATVSATGLVTGLADGTVSVQATYGG